VQDCFHYTDSEIEEHTNEDLEPKARSAATAGWAARIEYQDFRLAALGWLMKVKLMEIEPY